MSFFVKNKNISFKKTSYESMPFSLLFYSNIQKLVTETNNQSSGVLVSKESDFIVREQIILFYTNR